MVTEPQEPQEPRGYGLSVSRSLEGVALPLRLSRHLAGLEGRMGRGAASGGCGGSDL